MSNIYSFHFTYYLRDVLILHQRRKILNGKENESACLLAANEVGWWRKTEIARGGFVSASQQQQEEEEPPTIPLDGCIQHRAEKSPR